MGSFRAWASRLVELALHVHNSRGWRSQLRPSSLVVVSDVGYITVTAVYKGLGGLWVAYLCFLKCSLSRPCKRRNPIMVERRTMTDGIIDYSASSPWFCDYQYRQTHRNSSSMSILRGRAPYVEEMSITAGSTASQATPAFVLQVLGGLLMFFALHSF
jgi:hypothetical protein